MPNYGEPAWANKRLRYFDGQFLQSQDLIDDQMFHIATRHRHDRLLQVAGVAEGLTLSANGSVLTVAAGTAVDASGRQILLTAAATVNAPAGPIAQVLYILFGETDTDDVVATQTGGVEGTTRWTQTPTFGFAAAASLPAGAVALGTVNVAQNGTVTLDSSTRQYSGVRLPNAQGGITMRVTGDAQPQWVDLGGNLRTATGTITAAVLQATNSSSLAAASASSLTVTGGSQLNTLNATSATITTLNFTTSSGTTASVTGTLTVGQSAQFNSGLTVSGNVGVGTNTPTHKLQVLNDVAIGNGSAAPTLWLLDIPTAAWRITTNNYTLAIATDGLSAGNYTNRLTIGNTGAVSINGSLNINNSAAATSIPPVLHWSSLRSGYQIVTGAVLASVIDVLLDFISRGGGHNYDYMTGFVVDHWPVYF